LACGRAPIFDGIGTSTFLALHGYLQIRYFGSEDIPAISVPLPFSCPGVHRLLSLPFFPFESLDSRSYLYIWYNEKAYPR
jgi:hypothetical protein